MAKKNISVFFPVYNDEATIGKIADNAVSVLESRGSDYEIIIVNDGSMDNTEQVINELSKKNDKIKVIHHPKNKGYGGALKTGFANATKDLIFYTDSDGQYDVRELPLLLSSLEKDGVDVVNGYKINRADSLYRIIIGKAYYWMVRIAFNLRLKDITCDFRLMRRSIFDKIKLESDSGAVCVEMMKKIQNLGYKISEVPVHHFPRIHGTSQAFTFSNLFKTMRELIILWLKGFRKDYNK